MYLHEPNYCHTCEVSYNYVTAHVLDFHSGTQFLSFTLFHLGRGTRMFKSKTQLCFKIHFEHTLTLSVFSLSVLKTMTPR